MLKSRLEVSNFLANFETFAHWDGEKFFLTIETVNPVGTLTIMKNSEVGKFFYHRKNERYWDLKEIIVDTNILEDIIWVFRTEILKSLNKALISK